MSIYATVFSLTDDQDHAETCGRLTPTTKGDAADWLFFDSGKGYDYDPDTRCTCAALRAPYEYVASNQSITGPDHPRNASLFLCGAVGTNTLRVSINDATVLLDGRQVLAMRDALDQYCKHAENPANYGRQDAYDADGEPLDNDELHEVAHEALILLSQAIDVLDEIGDDHKYDVPKLADKIDDWYEFGRKSFDTPNVVQRLRAALDATGEK